MHMQNTGNICGAMTKTRFEAEQSTGSALLLVTALAAAALSVGLLVMHGWNSLGEASQAGIGVIGLALILIVACLALRRLTRPVNGGTALTIANVDCMTGAQFEACVAGLLAHQGFSVERVGHARDLGVDIVARRNGRRFAVQCKRYASPVSRRAISDAVAGVRHYGCDAAMVVTNSVFTRDAKTRARDNKCALVDRKELAKWLRG